MPTFLDTMPTLSSQVQCRTSTRYPGPVMSIRPTSSNRINLCRRTRRDLSTMWWMWGRCSTGGGLAVLMTSDDLNCWLSNCGHLKNGWKEQFYDVFWPFSVFIPSPFPLNLLTSARQLTWQTCSHQLCRAKSFGSVSFHWNLQGPHHLRQPFFDNAAEGLMR